MIDFFVKKRKITLLFFTMLILIGVFSFVSLPQQDNPDILADEVYTWELTGETEDQAEIFGDLAKIGLLIVVLIFLLITIQFNSMSTPILIMSTVYLAVSGSLIGLFLTQKPIGFMAILGVISLAGLVVRNGIVLIEFIEEARHAGTPLQDAVIAAGKARLRPILLTTFTAIGGLVPMATIGSPLFKPMAIAIIFGLLFSTILTLVIVPSIYLVLARGKEKKKKRAE